MGTTHERHASHVPHSVSRQPFPSRRTSYAFGAITASRTSISASTSRLSLLLLPLSRLINDPPPCFLLVRRLGFWFWGVFGSRSDVTVRQVVGLVDWLRRATSHVSQINSHEITLISAEQHRYE